MSLVEICTPIVNKFSDAEEAIQFLEKIGDKVKNSTEAYVLTKVLIGKIYLNKFNDNKKTKVAIL